ncbi:hypothetical protein FRC08_008754 [Ceratobasidium sp. 394]|nr:hypothetical protein FRC08_008754 [Ceratobasidium sp. 394]
MDCDFRTSWEMAYTRDGAQDTSGEAVFHAIAWLHIVRTMNTPARLVAWLGYCRCASWRHCPGAYIYPMVRLVALEATPLSARLLTSVLQEVLIRSRMVFLTSPDVFQAVASNLNSTVLPLGPGLAAESVCVDRTAPDPIGHPDNIEEKSPPLDDIMKDANVSFDEKDPQVYADDSLGDVKMVNGQPIIETGVHVSNFAIDVRDDGDAALTWRSFWIGTIVAGLGAALSQIYIFKPTAVSVSGIFLLLLVYTIGNAWAILLPQPSAFESRVPWLVPVFRVINPGPFGLKEHVVATVIATTAASGSTSVNIFAVQRLFYDGQ